MCRKQIRGVRRQGLGGVSSVKQFRLWHTGKSTVNSLQDRQLNEREFQTAGALTLKALAKNANDVRSTVSNSLSADLRQRPQI